tara:strand:+ start:1441 stop:2625 length:1185 start_codon:yes stop_codon:yes gene_type:complete
VLFQTFDDKEKCVLIYQDGALRKHFEGPSLSSTWSYANYLRHQSIEYAQIWAHGASLESVCPPHLHNAFQAGQLRLKALIRSCNEARVNLDDICFYDLAPQTFLLEWGDIKDQICAHVFKEKEKPLIYDHLVNTIKVISEIKYQPVAINLARMKKNSVKDRNMFKLMASCQKVIAYDPFKTVTGRLATRSGTFPALTLAKEYRQVLTPTNEWFLELDFNAAELRTACALLGHEQPTDDIHDWNIKNVFKTSMSREEAKKRTFGWLYNPDFQDSTLNAIYDRDKIKDKYFSGTSVITDFKREIECDEYHALNYIIQSTAADILFEQMYKVWRYLENKKSFIKFCNHDSIMIDLAAEDENDVNEIKGIFANTRYGDFKINCLGGKNWGFMKPLRIY